MRLSVHDWRVPLLVGAAFLFARLSSGRLPYFLFYTSAGLLILSLLWTCRTLRGLSARLELSRERLSVGESTGVSLHLKNRSLFPIPWLEVDDLTPGSLAAAGAPRKASAVGPRSSRVLTDDLVVRRRGHYQLGPVRLVLGDPFGLFRGQRELRSDQWITVYPRIHPLDGIPLPLSQPVGPVRSRRQAFTDHTTQATIRRYRPGDNPRHIHWKSTARTGQLMLREFEQNAAAHVLLLPDAAHEAYGPTEDGQAAFEAALEVAASLAALCRQRKIPFALAAHAQERFATAPGQGERPFSEVLEALAHMEARGQVPIEQVLQREAARLTGRTLLAVITTGLSPQLAAELLRLQPRHQVLLVLLRPASWPEPAGGSRRAKQLAASGTAVYCLPVGAAISSLAEYRVLPGPKGEMP